MNWDRGGWGRTRGSEERTRWRLRGPFTGFPNLPKLPQDMRVNEHENNDTKTADEDTDGGDRRRT